MVKRDETLTFQSSRYGNKEKMVSIDKVKEWLKYNFGNSFVIDCYGSLTNETEVTTSFDTMEQLLDDFEKTMENEYN